MQPRAQEPLFFPALSLAPQLFRPRYNARLRLLEAEIRIQQSRVNATRIVPNPKEKADLIRLGALFDHDISEVLHLVRPETSRKRFRHGGRGIALKAAGRPRLPPATGNLVLQMGEEGLRWGYRRVVGELKESGIRIGSALAHRLWPSVDSLGPTPYGCAGLG